jgi:hypothetical protein
MLRIRSTAFALLLLPAVLWAEIPAVVSSRQVLSDSGRKYFESISFFLVCLLLSAVAVRWLWNRLTFDFPKLPRMSHVRALTIVLLWGLLFLTGLTMIATAREMMMPGIWGKQGLLYGIPTAQSPTPSPRQTPRGPRP